MISSNLLKLPRENFPPVAICVGNMISNELEKNKFKAQYNIISKMITIFNTKDFQPRDFKKILSDSKIIDTYELRGWSPQFEQRNQNGNLEFSIKYSSHFALPLFSDDQKFEIVEPLQNNLLAEKFKEEEIFDKNEVTEMKNLISENVIKAMNEYLNKHEEGKGIWYPEDYKKYLEKQNKTMNESYKSGYANQDFFKKVGSFTFELKAGKKASEALLKFLEGPTIADCGNATAACYYKCILDILGEEKFNELYGSKPFNLRISQEGILDKYSPIYYLSAFTKSSWKKVLGGLGERPLKLGQEGHFSGVKWQLKKDPDCPQHGSNVICIGKNEKQEQLFLAHGFSKPLTENEINLRFIEIYNNTPQKNKNHSFRYKPYTQLKEGSFPEYLDASNIKRDPSKFINGFIPGTGRKLQAKELIKLKNGADIRELKSLWKKYYENRYIHAF